MSNHTSLGGTFTFPGTDLTVHRVGYGAMQLPGPHVWGPPRDHAAALAVLREAVRLGINHIDTADFYGPHVSNDLIREALSPYPEDLAIVTKIGFVRGKDASWNPAKSPEQLEGAVHANLERLGVEALDIVNLRFGEGGSLSRESVGPSLRVVADLRRQGLVRHIGLSNITPAQFREGADLADIVCVQNEYNLAHREDDALIDELADRGIAYVPYFPLGGFSPLQSETLSAVAKELGATPLQTALAWLLHRSPNILLIPGTSSVEHLRENVAAAALELPAAALARLDGM